MFNFGIDKRTMMLIIGAMAVLWILKEGTAGIFNTLLLLPGVLIALTFHEFAHAITAVKLGDNTPKIQGRVNLNPIKHVDPVGFIFLIVAQFGWGKPVEIDSRNFNSKHSISKAEAIVAAAGPLANFILAFIFLIIYRVVFIATDITAGLSAQALEVTYIITIYTIMINIGLGVFNLIPLPPLDGSKILTHFLPYNGKQWFRNNEQTFYIIFLLVWITGIAREFLQPVFQAVLLGMDWAVANLFSLFM